MADISLSPGGAIKVTFSDGASVTLADAPDFSVGPSFPDYHVYNVNAHIGWTSGNIELSHVRDALHMNPAPTYLNSSSVVRTGSITDTVGPGEVEHIVIGNGIVVNVTYDDDHQLHPGYVVRHAMIKDGALVVESVGIGNTNFLGVGPLSVLANNILGQFLFSDGQTIAARAYMNFVIENADKQCFPASTSISLSSGETVAIETITPDQLVLGFNPATESSFGPLQPARVVRLLPSITQEWMKVTAVAACADAPPAANDQPSNTFSVTPGHHFLNEDGGFEEIQSIVARGGQVVLADGSLNAVSAERIVYSAETAHLYEETEVMRYQTQGGLACEPFVECGWKTYNFEVEGVHTYVANGVRVHNESAWSFVQAGDGIPVEWYDHDGDGKDDEIVLLTDTKATRIYFTESDDGSHNIATRQVTAQENDAFDNDEYYVYETQVDVDDQGNPISEERHHLSGRGLGEAVGQSLTPFLASAIHGDDANAFEQIATETVLDTVLGNVGEFIGVAAHHSILADRTGTGELSVLDNVFDDIPTDFGVNLANNTVSVVNRLIMAEIFGSIELDGIDGAILEGLVSGGLDVVLSHGMDVFLDTVFEGSAVAQQFNPTNFTVGSVANIVLGAVLGEFLPQAQTVEGQIASAVVSTALSYLSGTTALSSVTSIAGLLPALGPAAAILVFAAIVGQIFDSIFGPEPYARASVVYNDDLGLFEIGSVYVDDGGDREFAVGLAEQYIEIMNTVVEATNGQVDLSSFDGRAFGHDEDRIFNGGTQVNSYWHESESTAGHWVTSTGPRFFADADSALESASVADLLTLAFHDGDQKVQRAVDAVLEDHQLKDVLAELLTIRFGNGLNHAESYKLVNVLQNLGLGHLGSVTTETYIAWESESTTEWATRTTFNFDNSLDLSSLEAFVASLDLPLPTDEDVNFSDLMSALAVSVQIAEDYQTYLENTEEINALIELADGSPVAAGWVATLIAAADMGLADSYTATGSSGDDTFWTADGDDDVRGGDGNDVINSYGGRDTLRGGDGDDHLHGGNGSDKLYGDAGNDTLYAGGGDYSVSQYLRGREGNDTYVIGSDSGQVRITKYAEDAGMGTDTVRFTDLNIEDVTIQYAQIASGDWGNALRVNWSGESGPGRLQVAQDGRYIQNFEFADGAVFNKFILGDHSNGNIIGGSGNDWINTERGSDTANQYVYGYEGDDYIIAAPIVGTGDSSNQYLYGRQGDDTYVVSSNSGDTFISAYAEAAGMGTDTIVFSDLKLADLSLNYPYAPDHAWYGSIEFNWAGEGFLRVAADAEIERYVFADGTSFELTESGTAQFRGTNDADVITGSRAVESALALSISGYSGDDTIVAASTVGEGDSINQYLYGRQGDDTYVIGANAGDTFITGYSEDTDMGTDTVRFSDYSLSDLTVSWDTAGDLWLDWAGEGALEVRADAIPNIERYEFADGTSLSSIALTTTGTAQFRGTNDADVMTGSRAVESALALSISGYSGDDTIIAASTVGEGDSINQYLYGRQGDDTYVVGSNSGDTFITGYSEDTDMGTDTVRFSDYSLSDLTVSWDTAGDLWLDWAGEGALEVRADAIPNIERYEFADGTSLSSIALTTTGTAQFRGTNDADVITGSRTVEGDPTLSINGYSGNDTIIAASRVGDGDSSNQYLHGRQGDDTYVVGSNSGDTFITGYSEEAGMGNDTIRFSDYSLSDLTVSWDTAGDLWLDWAGEGALEVRADAIPNIERYEFADGTSLSSIALTTTGTAQFRGTNDADVITGSRAVESALALSISGYSGDDTIIAASTVGEGDSINQYLYGRQGDDTYVIGANAGDTFITGYSEDTDMGTDTIRFSDYSLSDLTVSWDTAGDLWLDWAGEGALEVRADAIPNIERYEFADGTSLSSIALTTTGTAQFRGTNDADVITGSRAVESALALSISGYSGDDTIIAASTVGEGDSINQYLYGRQGDDTYVIGANAGDTFITGYSEDTDMGTDTVRFSDYSLSDLTVSWDTAGDLWLDWAGEGALEVRADAIPNIERYEFADGTSLDEWTI